MLAVAAAAVILAGVFYRRVFGAALAIAAAAAAGLRTVAILLVVLLLFRPVLSLERDVVERRSVVLALDTSASMSTADDATGTSRFDQARTRVLDWSARLKKDFDLHVVEFAERAAAAASSRASSRQLKPTARRPRSPARWRRGTRRSSAGDRGRRPLLGRDSQRRGRSRRHGPQAGRRGRHGRRRQQPAEQPVVPRCPGRRPGMPGAVAREQPRQDHGPRRPVRAGRPGREGDARGGRQARRPGRGRPARRGGAPGGRLSSSCPRSRGGTPTPSASPPCPKRRSPRTTSGPPWSRWSTARSACSTSRGRLRAEYGGLVQRFLSKDPDLEFCALVQTRPNVFVERTNMEGLKLTGLPSRRGDVREVRRRCSWATSTATLLEAAADGAPGQAGARRGGPAGLRRLSQPGPGRLRRDAARRRSCPSSRETATSARSPTRSCRSSRRRAAITRSSPTSPSSSRPPARPAQDRRSAAPGRLRAGQGGEARRPGAGDSSRRGRRRCPCWPSQPAGKGRVAVFTSDTTRNWQQAPRALGPGVAVHAVLGADDPLAGQPHRGGEGRGQASPPAPTRRTTSPTRPSPSWPRSATRTGEGTDQAEVVGAGQGPAGTTDAVTLAPVAGSAGNVPGTIRAESGPAPTRSPSRPRLGATVPEGREDLGRGRAGPTSSSTGSTSTTPCCPGSPRPPAGVITTSARPTS